MSGCKTANTYEEIRTELKELCKREGLKYIEDKLEEDDIICLRTADKVIFNIGRTLPKQGVTS